MGRDRQATGIVHRKDRLAQRAQRTDGPLHKERQEVPTERRDLLADHNLGTQAAVARHGSSREGGIDPSVVRDSDHVEVRLSLDVGQDGIDACRPVAGERMDMEIGAAASLHTVCQIALVCRLRHAAASRAAVASRVASASRSGQIGKKTAHH